MIHHHVFQVTCVSQRQIRCHPCPHVHVYLALRTRVTPLPSSIQLPGSAPQLLEANRYKSPPLNSVFDASHLHNASLSGPPNRYYRLWWPGVDSLVSLENVEPQAWVADRNRSLHCKLECLYSDMACLNKLVVIGLGLRVQ